MESRIFEQKIEFTEEELFAALKIPLDDEREETDIVRDLIEEAQKIARPKTLWKPLAVEAGEGFVKLDGHTFTEPLIVEKFSSLPVVFAYVNTCGTELDDWSKLHADPLEEYIADGIKVFYLGKIGAAFHRFLQSEVFEGKTFSSLNPGSLGAWPISGQADLFACLGDVEEKIGVTLMPSFLMVPTKSGSGIFFESDGEYHNCTYCPRITCPNRRAPFSGSTDPVKK